MEKPSPCEEIDHYKTPKKEFREEDDLMKSIIGDLSTYKSEHLRLELSERKPVEDSKRCCNCRKSKCLKLYCECFSTGQLCGQGCHCIGCFNSVDQADSQLRIQAIEEIIKKDKDSFNKRINKNTDSGQGCNCRKSSCVKNYCECYANEKKCGAACNCDSCKNPGPDYFMKTRRSKHQTQLRKKTGP